MTYQLKPQDIKDIEGFRKYNQMGRALQEFQNWRFEPGDVLVRYYKTKEGEKGELDLISENCPVPKKFRVVYVDELGVPWAKQLSVRRGLGKKLYCLLTYSTGFRWEIDPEKMDADLLGYEYDPRIEYKKMREEEK